MTTIHDLRRAAETYPHDRGCIHERPHDWIVSDCDCSRYALFEALDAAEKALQMCKEALDDGFTKAIGTEQHQCLYDSQYVNWVHKELAAFLTDDKGTDDETV